MLQGSNIGIIEGRRLLNNKSGDKNIDKLVKKYVNMQEKFVEILKTFINLNEKFRFFYGILYIALDVIC